MSCNCCCNLTTSLGSVVSSKEGDAVSSLSEPFSCWKAQHCTNEICFSIGTLHLTHFFIKTAQTSQAHIWPQGWNKQLALRSEQTMHSSIWTRCKTVSLQIRHFLQRFAHKEQATIWLHGWNKVSRLLSEQTIHSFKITSLFFFFIFFFWIRADIKGC